MNHDAQNAMQDELDAGETLIWTGFPQQGLLLRSSDVFMIPFSLMWGGFAIFWEIGALTIPDKADNPIGIIFPLFGIPFVLVGLYIIFGRFIYDSKSRSKTFYGLTAQRAIIVSGIFRKDVKSLNLNSLSDVSLSEKPDKSGTITFGQDIPFASMMATNSFPGMGKQGAPKFELIQNAKDVYNQLREQQKNS